MRSPPARSSKCPTPTTRPSSRAVRPRPRSGWDRESLECFGRNISDRRLLSASSPSSRVIPTSIRRGWGPVWSASTPAAQLPEESSSSVRERDASQAACVKAPAFTDSHFMRLRSRDKRRSLSRHAHGAIARDQLDRTHSRTNDADRGKGDAITIAVASRR